MNYTCIKFYVFVGMSLSVLFAFAKQPPTDIASDAAKYETNLLTKPQRDQLQVEMINLQRDIIAAHRNIDKLPDVKAAKDELARLRAEKAPRSEIVAANTKYSELKNAEQNKDPVLVKKLERYKYVATLLDYDKLRNKVKRARMPAEVVAENRPKVQMARPVYEKQVANETAEKTVQEETVAKEDIIPHNVIKLFENSEVAIAGKRVAWSELPNALAELYKQDPELELQVDGEVETPISKLMEMMKLAREAGFKDVSIRKLF